MAAEVYAVFPELALAGRAPNPPDCGATRDAFRWDDARARLAGLPGGGPNIAHATSRFRPCPAHPRRGQRVRPGGVPRPPRRDAQGVGLSAVLLMTRREACRHVLRQELATDPRVFPILGAIGTQGV
jgi:hypothetical protein